MGVLVFLVVFIGGLVTLWWGVWGGSNEFCSVGRGWMSDEACAVASSFTLRVTIASFTLRATIASFTLRVTIELIRWPVATER